MALDGLSANDLKWASRRTPPYWAILCGLLHITFVTSLLLPDEQRGYEQNSAATLLDVVTFYNLRFNIGLTNAQMKDLAAFLETM